MRIQLFPHRRDAIVIEGLTATGREKQTQKLKGDHNDREEKRNVMKEGNKLRHKKGRINKREEERDRMKGRNKQENKKGGLMAEKRRDYI
jgi:hypothetical protein